MRVASMCKVCIIKEQIWSGLSAPLPTSCLIRQKHKWMLLLPQYCTFYASSQLCVYLITGMGYSYRSYINGSVPVLNFMGAGQLWVLKTSPCAGL